MNGWIDEWMDEWMDGWMDGSRGLDEMIRDGMEWDRVWMSVCLFMQQDGWNRWMDGWM